MEILCVVQTCPFPAEQAAFLLSAKICLRYKNWQDTGWVTDSFMTSFGGDSVLNEVNKLGDEA